METQNMILYKTLLIFKGTALAAFVWFFEPLYEAIILNGFLPLGFTEIMAELKELIGFIVAFLVAIKLILQIVKIRKEK